MSQIEADLYQKRMTWFHEARFGMFIHYGLFSILAHGEWAMFLDRIPKDEYRQLADQFMPSADAAEHWVQMAKTAGMKYMVLTARHHDGFCLYDSAFSDYSTAKSACKRDLVAEYVAACRKAGLKVGIYYSLMDWRFPGYFNYKTDLDSAQEMKRQCYQQVRELMTNYGKIDLLWYDGYWLNHEHNSGDGFWEGEKLNAMVRELQPDIIINNRAGTKEDIDTPEQVVRHSERGRAWESCMTIGNTWGYSRYSNLYKSSAQLLHHLVNAASGEGNFLLNVGPQPDGYICPTEQDRLNDIGRWLGANGSAVYNSRHADLMGSPLGMWTQDQDYTYFNITLWCGETLSLPLIDGKIEDVVLLSTGQSVQADYASNGRIIFSGLPETPPDPFINTLRIKFTQKPKTKAVSDPAAWLFGKA